MLKIRKSAERGHFDHGWLKTYHTFSFSEYRDPAHMGFRHLRVINEDFVSANDGFDTHPHRDMEIITYILEGALEHKDSMGTGSVIRPGEVQRMSAGTGVTHSEFNPSKSEKVHLLQIWILPEKKGLTPSYEQKTFSPEQRDGKLVLVASPGGKDGSVTVHQDAQIFVGGLKAGQKIEYKNLAGRHLWIQVARGELTVEANGTQQALQQGDGASLSQAADLKLTYGRDSNEPVEFLLFDMS